MDALAELDLTDPTVQREPAAHYGALRSQRVVYSPAHEAFVVLCHPDALAVMRDPATFSSQLGSNREPPPPEAREEVARIAASGLPHPRTLLDNDPPDHARYRRLVARAFTPRRMAALRPSVVSLCEQLIDGWADPSHLEFVAQFAGPLPVDVIATALNIPRERRTDFQRWASANTATIGAQISAEAHIESARVMVEMQRFLVEQFEERMAAPADDLFTTLLHAHVGANDDGTDAEPFTMPELVRIVQQLLVAGSETTTKLLAEMVRLIAATDGEWDRLKHDPTRIPAVVEESLRLASPNQGMFRVATRDTVVADVAIPKGSKLIVMFASANRDEAMFDEPNDMCPQRANLQQHMAFGFGAHFCVGASLARLEAAVTLERFVERVDSYRLRPENTFEYQPSFVLRGLKQLHLDVTRAAR